MCWHRATLMLISCVRLSSIHTHTHYTSIRIESNPLPYTNEKQINIYPYILYIVTFNLMTEIKLIYFDYLGLHNFPFVFAKFYSCWQFFFVCIKSPFVVSCLFNLNCFNYTLLFYFVGDLHIFSNVDLGVYIFQVLKYWLSVACLFLRFTAFSLFSFFSNSLFCHSDGTLDLKQFILDKWHPFLTFHRLRKNFLLFWHMRLIL